MSTSDDLYDALRTPAGQRFYRSLRERAGETCDEVPPSAEPGEQRFELNRRELTALLGASLALAGLSGCSQNPRQKILPYVRAPVGVAPGLPLEYATTMTLGGFGTGLIGVVQDGRPIKLDGNPHHPAAVGGSSIFEQAAVLGLYDPARLTSPMHGQAPVDWNEIEAAVARCGPRVWFVLPPQTSQLVAQGCDEVRNRLPGARFVHYQALAREAVYSGTRSVFGRALETHYHLASAEVILGLDADFTAQQPGASRMASDFAKQRRRAASGDARSRLYVAEAALSPTGSLADHRLPVPSSRVPALARAVLRKLSELGAQVPELPGNVWSRVEPESFEGFAAAVARDLASAGERAVVIVGERQPTETHVLAHAINQALGGFGQTVRFTESPLLRQTSGEGLEDLCTAIAAGEVDALVVLEENLVYSAPPRLRLAELLRQVPQRFHLTAVENETSRLCQWRLPLCHFLESWGDARAVDGTLSYAQPLIAPLHASRTIAEVLAMFAGRPASAHSLLRELHRRQVGDGAVDAEWEQRLGAGFVAGSAAPRVDVRVDVNGVLAALSTVGATVEREKSLELNFTLGNVHDGRFVNNAWLLELPHPMTKQCWGNAAVLSPETAAGLGLRSGDVLAITVAGCSLEAPALVLPGHANETISLDVGYGYGGEGLGRDVGVNAYTLRTKADEHFVAGARVTRTSKHADLAVTQEHFALRGRDYVRTAELGDYRRLKVLAPEQRAPQRSLLPPRDSAGVQWAMSIDTTICSGCSACVVACQAENNVPVVGPRGVRQSREMHWLRIDRYFEGSPSAPSVVNQPMLCQHCEKAPCEYVCPVNATVHSPDGLNEMVYNRCIGTRFCSNNCPYKVRRFNWFDYSADPRTPRQQKNPEVTVRERGVMEKCTFCVQRIRRAERQARIEQRPDAADQVVTACQAACPTEAIQFGSLGVADGPLRRARSDGRSYSALHELGTHPRVTYLAKIRNPNPELKE
jgi:molybdopterin-containing oxidoreductase family iron-sulfur binding subunit